MAPLDNKNVEDLLFGPTDPRQVALFLAQQSLTMDAVERDQRLAILNALNTHSTQQMAVSTQEMAVSTQEMAVQTARLAKWTSILALLTIIVAGSSLAVAIVAIL